MKEEELYATMSMIADPIQNVYKLDTRKEVEIRVRDDYEAIYYFLRYCMKLKKREEIGEDFFNYLVYILCEPCLP